MAQTLRFFSSMIVGRAHLAWSAGFHVAVTALIISLCHVLQRRAAAANGAAGGGGEAMGVTLVSSVPLPSSPTQTQNVLANESKGVTQSKPKEEEKEPDAIEIQGKNAKTKPKQITLNQYKPKPEPERTNQVAFGEGGPVSGPYGNFAAGGAKGGFGVTGGGGDFGTRYGWYVQVIQRKVSENWLKYEVDPRITRGAARLHHFRHRPRRPSFQRAGRTIERRTVARYFGGPRAAAHRHIRPSTAGLQRQQNLRRVLVRLQKNQLKLHLNMVNR